MTEWRSIPWNLEYEVSSEGFVRRQVPGRGTHVGRELTQRLSTNGYLTVMIKKDGRAKPVKVHQIVADAFIRVRVTGDVVNHLDGCKTNNSLSNLEITTREGNAAHAVANGLIRSGINHGMAKLSDAQVVSIRQDFNSGLSGSEVAFKYGINRNYAYQIKRGEERKSA